MKPLRSIILPFVSVMLLAGMLAAQSTAPSTQNTDQQPADQQANASNSQANSAASQTNSGDQQPQTLIDPGAIYNSKEAGTWIGKSVTLKNVNVQDTNKTGNFWVGSDDHHRLLIVKASSNLQLNSMRVHKGDIVTISGNIRAASEAMSEKTGAEKGSMRDAENSSGVFLLANSVNIESSTEH